VTTRFPLTDLACFQGQGYWPLDVGGLDSQSARTLLRGRGVRGNEAVLTELIDAYGAHALTLDHLGGVIGQFLDGDPRRAPEAPHLSTPGSDRQALRLARLLRAYEEHLPPEELALLCRLCLLRRSLIEEQVAQMFLCSPPVHPRTVRELTERIAKLPTPPDPLLNLEGHAEAASRFLEETLCTSPVAGPEEVFRREVLDAASAALLLCQAENDPDFAELADLYARTDLDVPDDLHPLSAEDRHALRTLCTRYLELRRNPLMPFNDNISPALEMAFLSVGSHKADHRPKEDLRPDDLLHAYKRVRLRLRHLTGKHFFLRRVRQLCRFYQRKWSLAGPLAPLDADGLRRVLDALVSRHLAVREADGSFSIHPAVRDHFFRVASAPREAGWHDLLREQMLSLVQQPGQRLPQDTATLDLVEEAIFHALQAGQTDEAVWLYREVLGGLRHLAWKLGEMARGLRILRGFDPCPEGDDLAWFLRAQGELDEAHALHPFAYFRADVRLLQGRLPEVAQEGDATRSATAAFLMGQAKELPPDLLSCAVPRDQLLLYRGRLAARPFHAQMEALYHDMGWEGDRARHRLIQAEEARQQGDLDGCRAHLDIAMRWVLHSGSVEHLCLWHLVRARVARDADDAAAARRAVEEGISLSRLCGLELYYVELLCEQAEQYLKVGDAAAAEDAAREAMQRAAAAACRFLWGAGQAGHLLGQALATRGNRGAAVAALHEALELRRNLGDPRAGQTERLLKRVEEAPA
jgi:hypothetical protein